MKTLVLSKLLVLFLAQVVFAQIDVEVTKSRVITGLVNPKTINEFVLFEQELSQPKFSPAALIKVTTKYKFVRVKARQTLFEATNVGKLSDTEYLLVGSGKFALEVTAFDPELGIDERTVVVDLGDAPTPEPDPTPDPDPDTPTPSPIPDDQFDNLGRKVYDWSKNLPKRKEVATLYGDAIKSLTEDPKTTINGVTVVLADQRTQVLGSDSSKYVPFIENLNAELKLRWPMSRFEFIKYLEAVKAGLEG
jgi:hypothetical protein